MYNCEEIYDGFKEEMIEVVQNENKGYKVVDIYEIYNENYPFPYITFEVKMKKCLY